MKSSFTLLMVAAIAGAIVCVYQDLHRNRNERVSDVPRIDPELTRLAIEVIERYRDGRPPTSTSGMRVLHALRNFREGAALSTGESNDAVAYVSMVCDNNLYEKHVEDEGLIEEAGGLPGFRRWTGANDGGEGHLGQFLMFFAEMDVPLETAVRANQQTQWTLADIVLKYQRDAHAEQDLSWLLPGLAHYRRWDTAWSNKFGESVSLAGLLDAHLAKDPRRVSCAGTHHFYAVAAVAEHVVGQGRRLPPAARKYLQTHIRLAEQSQLADGRWGGDWLDGDQCSSLQDPLKRPPVRVRLRVTGHLLECLALGRRVEPVSRESLSRAIRWTCWEANRVLESPNYFDDTVLAHAIHGLRLCVAPE